MARFDLTVLSDEDFDEIVEAVRVEVSRRQPRVTPETPPTVVDLPLAATD